MKKDNKHIDQKFTDHAWQNMAMLLDQEMPVKKRKKRFVWIWGFGIGLVLLLGWNFLQNENNPILSAFPIIRKSITPGSSIADNFTDNQSVKTNNNKTIINTLKNKISPDVTPVINTIKKLTLTSHPEGGKFFPSSEASFSKNQASPNPINFGKTVPIIKPLSIKKSPIITPSKTLNQQIDNSENRKTIAIFDKIPTLNLGWKKLKKSAIPIPKTNPKFASKWSIGVYAGLLSPKNGSFRAGISTRYTINPRWAINLGLGYSKRDLIKYKNLDGQLPPENDMDIALPSEAEDTMISLDTTGGSGPDGSNGAPGDPSTFTSSDPVQSLNYTNFHYFDLPVFVQYKITPRWSIEVGGQVSRLYGYHYIQNNESFFATNKNQDSQATRTSIDENPIFSSWQFSTFGGTSFAISPKLQIYSNYHFGLNDFSKLEIADKKWKQVEVGVRYYLK